MKIKIHPHRHPVPPPEKKMCCPTDSLGLDGDHLQRVGVSGHFLAHVVHTGPRPVVDVARDAGATMGHHWPRPTNLSKFIFEFLILFILFDMNFDFEHFLKNRVYKSSHQMQLKNSSYQLESRCHEA